MGYSDGNLSQIAGDWADVLTSFQQGSGSATGILAQDSVSLGGIPVPEQYWGAVQSESSDFVRDPISGLMGLAFGSIAASGRTPYFENLVNTNAVSSPLFSFQLLNKQPTGSQLCLGCFDSSRFSKDILWSPIVSQTYWSLSMTGLTADGSHNAIGKTIIGVSHAQDSVVRIAPTDLS